MHNLPSVPMPQEHVRCPWSRAQGRKHEEVLAPYDPSEKGAQLCKVPLEMVFVRADTHLPHHLCSLGRLSYLHSGLKKVHFQPRPIRASSLPFWMIS